MPQSNYLKNNCACIKSLETAVTRFYCTADMEEKVQGMLKLIEEDGDSFAKRAEMYYKRRPELITSVEEAFKSFRALADRYDMLSKELQTANHTIATVFPEQVQFMDDDDDSVGPKVPKNAQIPPNNSANAPKIPKPPVKDLKSIITTASKQLQDKKASQKAEIRAKNVKKSGLTKEQALGQIDKLQKDILSLQTVKEFVKSSYETGVAKYWGIENQIAEMHEKVGRLQDEFNVDTVIEDDEARTLMAEAALKSCQEILTQLEEKQEVSEMEAREEYKRIEAARELLDSLKHKYLKGQTDDQESDKHDTPDDSRSETTDVGEILQQTKDIEPLQDSSKQNVDTCSMTYLTVSQLAEKIDQLVDKVINLETAVSSQTVLITTLKTESDELHTQIRSLEGEKESLINDSEKLRSKVREMEEKLAKIQNLNKNVERQNSNLQTNFAEARTSLGHLSERVSSVKLDEEEEETISGEDELDRNLKDEKDMPVHGDKYKSVVASTTKEKEDFVTSKTKENEDAVTSKTKDEEDVTSKAKDKEEVVASQTNGSEDVIASPIKDKNEVKEVHVNSETPTKRTVTFLDQKPEEPAPVDHSVNLVSADIKEKTVNDEELNWQQMLLSGMEDREKILIKEYTTILRNFKDVKKKLSDMEKKERDSQFDVILKMRAQKKAILKRDEEIQHLRKKLSIDDDEDRYLNPESPTTEESTMNEEDEMELTFIEKTSSASIIEEKFRSDINAILDESLDFWLRFSTSFHQIKKFKTEVQDLQDEIAKIEEKKKQEGNLSSQTKSEARPIYKHLREIQRELTIWLEQSVSLKEELKRRFTSLCNIQQDITKSLQESTEEDEVKFSSHQAAILQGEIMNMKQENNKVKEELQTGFDHVSLLQLEIEKTLIKLSEEFAISSDQPELKNAMSRSKIPLRSFIFGKKVRKPRQSIFSRYQILRSAMPNLHHSSN